MERKVRFCWPAVSKTKFLASSTEVGTETEDPVLGLVRASITRASSEHDGRLDVTLTFAFDELRADEATQHAARLLLEKVRTFLAVSQGILCSVPTRSTENLAELRAAIALERDGIADRMAGHSATGTAATGALDNLITFAPDVAALEPIFAAVLDKHDSEPFLRTHRLAIELEEPVAEFVLQYAILGFIYGGEQRQIDDGIDPARQNRSLGPKGKRETPYTRVRNELMHASDRGRLLADVVTECRQLLPGIREASRTALLKRLGV